MSLHSKLRFGAASAAYQIEGAYKEDGKGLSIWDEYANTPGNTYHNTNGNIAADHYHRFSEDIELMAELGLEVYRFSISWTRIFPNGRGKINQKGLEFYKNLCRQLKEKGIEPMVTLYHWDLPLALQNEYGGFESRKVIDDFLNYASLIFDELHEFVSYWIVMNEPNIFTQMGYLTEMHPPKKNSLQLYLQTFHHTALAHAKTVLLFKEKGYKGMIGSSIAFTPAYAASDALEDLQALDHYRDLTSNWYFESYYCGTYPKWAMTYYHEQNITLDITKDDMQIMKEASQVADFIGINYYQSARIAYNPIDGVGMNNMNTTGIKGSQKESGIPGVYKQVTDASLQYTDWDWAIDPRGLKMALKEVYDKYRLPIIISENGLGAFDKVENGQIHDDYRISYLQEHIDATEEAIEEGIEVIAYCIWSFTDLLSWLNGYQKRYGLVYIDFEDEALLRIRKDSYFWYQKLIKEKRESICK